ncbi:MAG TPA: ABC transporter ATP-binding protein [Thermoplasmatales archaeon]|nr:ABC transporter ATP-binding protein [Thermoplasmatales archaeon]
MNAIEVNNLVKRYGKIEAVKGISFKVEEGEIFGLIGPNGAGKTTTLRIIATLLQITEGEVKIFEYDLKKDADEIRKIISYLPEDAGAYKNLTGREYLRFIAGFFDGEEIVERGIKIADLGRRIDDKIETYSKGMTRRLLVARALMNSPKLAILDEPTTGLDVINAQEIRKIIQKIAKDGTTVLLSSHNMLEIEFLCDKIALINEGKIIEEGNPEELKGKYSARNIEEVFTEVVN